MKRSLDFKRAVVLVAMLAILLVVLAGCGKAASSDEFNQFVPPSSNVNQSGETQQGTKVAISGEAAIKTLFDSFVNAQASGTQAANVLDFSFAPYFSIIKDGLSVTYTIDVKGSIHRDDNDKSVLSFEIIKAEEGDSPITILGMYAAGGNIVIDSRNLETGEMVHQYYVDDMDISFLATTLESVLNQLDAKGFIKKFSVKDMMNSLGVDLSGLPIDLNQFLKLDGTLLDLILSLVVNNTSERPEDMCYMTDMGNGVTQLVMPLSINGILENISLISPIITNALAGQSTIVKTIVNLLFGDILSGRTTMKMYIRADIKDNMFQKAAFSLVTEGSTTKENEVGIGEFAACKDSNFAKNIVAGMPSVAKTDGKVTRADYSFTTISLDLGVTLDVAQHTYTVGALDSAIGGAIGGLLGSLDGKVWKEKELEIGEGGLTINLLLKVRAELNLKNNDKTRISLELFGSADNKLRIGAYYKGVDNALYIDMSGMGGGKIKVSNYYKYILESQRGQEVSDDNENYALNEDGTYRMADNGEYIKVKRPINLNRIIADALDKYIPQIPSLLDIVNKALGIGSSAEVSDESVLGIATLGEIAEWIKNGDVIVPHYGMSSDNAALSAADDGESVDVFGLITSILGCAVIKKGDTALSLNGLYIYMTKDVINTIFVDALGLNLPIEKLNVALEQTPDEGWTLNVDLELAKNGERLATANVFLMINYGNPDPNFPAYFDKLPLYAIDDEHPDGYLDTDWLHTDESGALDNINLNLSLDTRFTFAMPDEAEFDLSPLGQLLANLAITLKAEDEVNVDIGVKIAANVNAATLIGLIQGKKEAKDLIASLEARIDIGRYGEDYTIMLYLNKGVLYIDATKWGMPKYKLDLTEILAGNFKLFGKQTSAKAAEDATASYVTDDEAKDDTGILGVIFMMLDGVKIDNSALEMALTDRLFSILFGMIGIEWGEVTEITTEGTNIRIEYDGLNLSKLWVEINIGMQQGVGNSLNTSLGLGHIAIGFGNKDLSSDLDLTDCRDIMNGGNIFLGLQAEIDIYLKENNISLDNMLGALIADANSAIGTTININDTINGGILLTLMVDLDIASNSASNDTTILIELRRKSDYSVMLGLYYKHDGANGGKLYLDTTGTMFQPVALDIDLISLLGGLIGGKPSSAMAADGEASALDLGGLNPVILLGNRGVQIKVLQGITDLIFDLLVGDFNDYIEYSNVKDDESGSRKFYEYTPDTLQKILDEAAKNADGTVKTYQKSFDQYVRVDGAFVAYDGANEAHKGLTVYAKAIKGAYFYLKVKDPTDPQYSLDQDILNNAISDGKGGYKIFVMKNSGGTYVEVTKDNAGQYSEDIGNATIYAQFKYIPATMLVKGDEANIAGYGEKGFVESYNENITDYVSVAASPEDIYLYKIYQGNAAIRPNDTSDNPQAIQLKIPELGAVVHIGKIVKDGDSTVSMDGGDNFSGIGIGIFIWPFGTAAADRTKENLSANLAIKLGNIMLSDAKFKNASYNINKYGLADFITNEVAAKITNTASAANLNDLTVYVNVEAAIDLKALQNVNGEPYDWALGGILSAVLGGKIADKPELLALISSLLLKLDVPGEINTVIGLRIAGNLKIGRLLNSKATDTLGKVLDMLMGSEVAVEIYNNYVHADGAKMVVGLYIEKGVLYVHADGALVSNTKFKIELANVISLIDNIGNNSEALAAAETAATDIVSILGVINGVVDSIEINNRVGNKSLTVNFGAKMLTALVGLIAGVEGIELPELNTENSYLTLNTTRRVQPGTAGYVAENDYILKLSLGIDPLVIAVVLGGLEIGLADDKDVIPGDKPLSADTEYKTIDQLADNVSLNIELGVKLDLNEGDMPIGLIISTIMQELGYDIEFPLDIDLQDTISLDLSIQLQANLDLNNLGQSEIKLAIINNARTTGKTVLGVYFSHEKNGDGIEVPVLFVETNFGSQKQADGTYLPNRWKINDFNLLDSLLGDIMTKLVGVLSSEVNSGGSALVAADQQAPTTAEILLELQKNSIKLKVGEQLILALMNILIEDGVSEELYAVIDSLEAAAEVAITTGGDKGVGIEVGITTKYINVGLAIRDPQISLSPYTTIFDGLELENAEKWSQSGIGDYVDGKSALSLNLGLTVDYDIGNGAYNLNSFLADIAKSDLLKGDATMTTIGALLKNLTLDVICQNTRGYIGINVVINMLTAQMNDMLPAVGKYLSQLVMGKINPDEVVTDGEGNTFDALSLLSMVEAGIFIDLNGKQVVISIAQEEVSAGTFAPYVYITLEHFGGDNIKISLAKVIESIKSVTAKPSSALAAEETTKKETDYALIGKILGNAISSVAISKNNGLDIALAPTFLSVLLAELLGDKLSLSTDTLNLFKLRDPYVKMNDLGTKVTADDVEYLMVSEERYVRYRDTFKSQEAYLADMAKEGKTDYAQLYYKDTHAYDAYADEVITRYLVAANTEMRLAGLVTDDGKFYVYKEVTAGAGKVYVEYVKDVDGAATQYVLVNGKYMAVTLKASDGRKYVTFTEATLLNASQVVLDNNDVYVNTAVTGKPVYKIFDAVVDNMDAQKYVIAGNAYLATEYSATKYVRYAAGSIYHVDSGEIKLDNSNYYAYVKNADSSEYAYVVYDAAEHGADAQLYVKSNGEFVPVSTSAIAYVRYSYNKYISAGNVTADTNRYILNETTGNYEVGVGAQQYVKVGENYLPVYRKVEHSGITWTDKDGLGIALIFADQNGAPGFSFKLGLDANLGIKGMAQPVFPKVNNPYSEFNEKAEGGMISLSFVISLDLLGKEGSFDIGNLLKQFIADSPTFKFSDLAALGILLNIADFENCADIRVSIAVSIGDLVSAITAPKFDILALLSKVELAIEPLFMENEARPADKNVGDAKGGIYLYNGNLYIDYINDARGVYAVSLAELFGMIGGGAAEASSAYAAEGSEFTAEAAMLQLWIGEYVSFGGIASTGIAVRLTTTVVEGLLSALLKKPVSFADNIKTLAAEITINTGEPEVGADGKTYAKIVRKVVDLTADQYTYVDISSKNLYARFAEGYTAENPDGITKYYQKADGTYAQLVTYAKVVKVYNETTLTYDDIVLGAGESYTYAEINDAFDMNTAEGYTNDLNLNSVTKYVLTAENTYTVLGTLYAKIIKTFADFDGGYVDTKDPSFDITCAEGYNNAYPDLTAKYVKNEDGTYKQQKYSFSLDSFSIGIGLQIASLTVSIGLGNFDFRFVSNEGIIPDVIKDESVVVPEETVIDLGLSIELGLIMTEGETKFDLGKFVDNLGLIDAKLGEGWLLVSVPNVHEDGAAGSAEIRIILEIAIELNLTKIDKTVAQIRIIGQSYDPEGLMGETLLGVIYLKDGELLLDLSGLGFGKIKLTGLVLSGLLGADSIFDLLGKTADASASSALVAGYDNPAIIGIEKGSITAVISAAFFANMFDLLVPLKYTAAADGKYVLVGDKYEVYDAANVAHEGLVRYNSNESTKKLLSALGLSASLKIGSLKAQFTEDPNGKYVLVGKDYVEYDENIHSGLKRYKFGSVFAIEVNAAISELIEVNIAIDKIKIGNTHVGETVANVNAGEYIEAARLNFGKDANGKATINVDVLLEMVSLNLQLDLTALFTDGMFVGDQVAVGSVGTDLVGITALIKADIKMASLMQIVSTLDTKNMDTAQLLRDILPMISAQISIVRADQPSVELIGIYIIEGDVVVKLDGLGMPNIRITNDFLLDIIGAVATGSSALAAADETASQPSTIEKVFSVMPKMFKGVYLVQKSVRIALTNDYFVTLLDTLLFPGSSYYQDVMPDPSENNPDSVDNNNFSGIIINFNDLFKPIEYVKDVNGQYVLINGEYVEYKAKLHAEAVAAGTYERYTTSGRNGLLQIDLDMYSTHLNIDLFLPTIRFNDTQNKISLPDNLKIDKTIDRNDTSINVSLSLAGQLKIDKNEGVALANVLRSVVGDLETKLVIEDDIDIRFRISAAVQLSFSLAEKTFNISGLQLLISIARVKEGVEVKLAEIYYAGDELFLDLSYFFKSQDPDGSKNLGKLKVTGVNILGLLGGLLSGNSSVSEALVASGDTNAWVPATNNKKIYTPATVANTVAPQKFVLLNVKEADGVTDKTAYNRLPTSNSTLYVESTPGTYVVYDSTTAVDAVQGYALVDGIYEKLFIKDIGVYKPYMCGDDTMLGKAKYYNYIVTEYVKYDEAVHGADAETYVKAYNATDCTYSYVLSTAENSSAPTIYRSDGKGGYNVYTGTDTKYVIDYVEVAYNPTTHAGMTLYKKSADGTSYVKLSAADKVNEGETVYIKDFVAYDSANLSHAKKGLYISVAGAYEQIYIQSSIYALSAVWAVVAEGSDTASVYITGKAMLGLIGKALNNQQIADILDTLLITVNASRSPFVFGVDVSILDVYNNYEPAVSLHLNLFGFDHPNGSSLSFPKVFGLGYKNTTGYRTLIDVDLNKIVNAAEIKDVLLEALTFGGKNGDGKLYLNAAISLDTLVNETGTTPKDWAPFIANILGLSENEVKLLFDVFYGLDENGNNIEAEWGYFTLELAAAIDVNNLIGGLLDGSGLNLTGTEIQITLCMNSPHLAESIRGKKIYITIIGEDTDGLTGIYIDLSEYRGKGKHKLSLNLAGLIGDSLGSSANAIAAADVNTGMLPANIFNIINAIVGELRLADGKISIGLKKTFLGDLLNTFAGLNIDKTQSLVTGEIYLDIRNLGIGANLYVGNVTVDPTTGAKESDIGIALKIGNINLAPQPKYQSAGTFIGVADRAGYTNLLELVLDIDMEIEYKYESTPTGVNNPPVDLSKLIGLVEMLLGKKLFDNPVIQLVAEEAIDATYTFKLNVHIDLGQLTGAKTLSKDCLQITLEMWRSRSDEAMAKRFGLYLDGENIYVDLSPLGLPKLSVDNLNLGKTLKGALSGIMGTLGGGAESGSALAASDIVDDAFRTKWGANLLSGLATPYFSLVFRPNAFALGFNSELINALLETLSGALGKDIQLPDFGDIAILVDSSSGDLRPSLVARLSNEFYISLGLTQLHINGNINNGTLVNGTPVTWDTASSLFAENVYKYETVVDGKTVNDEFTTVYDVATGEIGLGRLNVGFDMTIRQDGYNSNSSTEAGGFEFYLYALLSGLLKNNNLGVDFNLNNGTNVIGYDISLRASVNIAKIISALAGNGDDWWSDVQLYLSMKPNNTTTFNGGSYGYLIKAYKMSGDADVFVDLSGLSLPKVKLVGLGGLIGGLTGSVSDAMVAEDGAQTAEVKPAARITIAFNQNGMRIDIGMGVIDGILNLLGDTLTIGSQTYTHGTATATLKTITIGTTTIPVPIMSDTKAISLALTYPAANKPLSLGIDLGLGLDSLGNNVKLSIDNFVLSTDKSFYDAKGYSKYVMFGAVKGVIQTSGDKALGVYDNITADNANQFSGLILNDAYGVSIYNILADVLGGINPNINITWNKNTAYKWSATNNANNVNGTDLENRTTTIAISRTTTSTKSNRGKKIYAGKIEAYVDFKTVNRQIGVWLFNNQIYGDISALLTGLDALLGRLGYDAFKITDLDILGLIGGLAGSSSDETATGSTAMAAEEKNATAAAEGESSLLDTLAGIISGIEINWWYNVTDPTKALGNKDISSLRININAQGLNDLLTKVYYLIYTLYDANAAATLSTADFGKLPYDIRKAIVSNDRGTTVNYNGVDYNCYDSYEMCVWYLQVFLQKMLGGRIGTTIGNALSPGVGSGGILGGVANGVLREVLGSLLPLPWLDANKASYIEVVLDKSKIGTSGVISEIGVYLNKEKVTLNETDKTVTRNVMNNTTTYPESTEIIIALGGTLEMRAVKDVRTYDTTKANWDDETPVTKDATSKVVYVSDAFDPTELSAASLAGNSNLLQVVDAKFYGIDSYTSKSENDYGNKTDEKDNAILGGTKIIWDTSTVNLTPGATSTMTGYALNYPVQTVTVTVRPTTGFSRLYGYIDASGNFVSANRIIVDPTLDPQRTVKEGDVATVAELPSVIVILRKDGELQVIDADFDAKAVKSYTVDGMAYLANGKFGWIDPTASEIKNGGTMEVKFWYQVGASSRIQKSVTVTYNNSSIVKGILPGEEAKFGILNGGNAGDFTADNIDILSNFGIDGLKVAASGVTKTVDVISSKLIDGTTMKYVIDDSGLTATELTESANHTAGLKGTFTRYYKETVLQTGTYRYEVATAGAGGGLLDGLSGLLGGGDKAATDKGSYVLSVDGGNPVKSINVELFNGNISTVEVLSWDFSELEYNINSPEKGVRGTVKAIVHLFENKLDEATAVRSVVDSKQTVEINVSVARFELSGITAGPDSKKTVKVAFNQYDELFVPETVGYKPSEDEVMYVYLDNVVSTEVDAQGNAVIYKGYVKYNEAEHGTDVQLYRQNILKNNEIYVRVQYTAIDSYVKEFNKDAFAFYTKEVLVAGGSVRMFVISDMKSSTEKNIDITASYLTKYEQKFNFTVSVTSKVAEKAVVMLKKDTAANLLTGVNTATILFKDGTSMDNVCIKNIVTVDETGKDVIGYKNYATGVFTTTATVYKAAADGTEVKDFTQTNVTLEIRVY